MSRGLPGEDFAEQQRLLCQPASAIVRGKKIDQLIAKNAGAAGLEDNERHAGVDLRSKLLQDFQQILTCLVQEAEEMIYQRPPTADVLCRHLNLEPRRAKHLMRRTQYLGLK